MLRMLFIFILLHITYIMYININIDSYIVVMLLLAYHIINCVILMFVGYYFHVLFLFVYLIIIIV